MVHGVGRHDRLSSLLEVYQAIRANLRSPEAPALVEDRIPDWKLERFEESASPPYLKLKFRFDTEPGDAAVVYLYEVNYSALAGVIRSNHRLDLTTLFVGLDVAVCSARQRQAPEALSTLFPGRPVALARSLQRVSGVMAAATGPLLGAPSLLLSRYGSSFVAAFTRFFEDVATYALDKSGEQLISEHLDRVVVNICSSEQFAGTGAAVRNDFIMAAHSLGGVITHSYLVRHWGDRMLPGTVVTFGSPIGLITWLWLFLDFEAFDFNRWRQVDTYFCWDPIVNKAGPGTPLKWVNVVNCLDPIASAFPDQAVELSRTGDKLRDELGGGVTHCHCGPAKFTATGRAHTDYLHDRDGFLEILLRAAGLRPGAVEEVACNRPRDHWSGTWRVLGRVRLVMWFTAIAFALGYCAIVAWHFQEWRVMAATFLFAIPAVTVGGMAFVQRFFFGGRTKRISRQRIASLRWDPVSLPYRLRQIAGDLRKRIAGLPLNDVGLPSHRPWVHRLNKLLAFLPTLAAMLMPAGIGWLITGRGPSRYMPVSGYVFPLLAFIIYLMACAVFELVSAWRSMLVDLELVPAARVAAKD